MRIITLLLTLFLTATTAQATPPQTVGVSETLLGVNDTHLFVLRRLDDNMGSHYPTQTDVVLIARNRKTNLDEQNWPVMRMIDHGIDFIEFGFETQVEPLPLKDRVNPFDILLWRKARPLLTSHFRTPQEQGITTSRNHGVLTITSDNVEYRLQDSVMSKLITDSLNATRRALPPYFIEGENRGEVDSLLDVKLSPALECKYAVFNGFHEYEDAHYQDFWIAHVTCDSEYAMALLSMFLMVSRVK